MVPSESSSCICISNFKIFHGILDEIDLFKRYMEKSKVLNLPVDLMDIIQVNYIIFVQLNSPYNQLLNGIFHIYQLS